MSTATGSKLDMIMNAGRGRGGSMRGNRGMERGRGGRGRGHSTFGGSSSERGRGNPRPSFRGSVNHSNSSNRPNQKPTQSQEQEQESEAESEASTSSSSSSQDPQSEILSRTSLNLSSNPLPPKEALISTLSKFIALRKIEITNVPKSIDWPNGLDELNWLRKSSKKSRREVSDSKGKGKEKDQMDEIKQAFGDVLTTLNVSGNDLGQNGEEAWKGLEGFKELFALNASHCSLSRLPDTLLSIASLKALVLSHNSLSTLPSIFPLLPNLNTLILSHNSITKIPKSLPASLPLLKKLGLSFNKLSYSIPTSSSSKSNSKSKLSKEEEIEKLIDDEWVDFTMCSHLREIRLNSNSDLETLPSHLVNWGKGLDLKSIGLEILDLGDCGLLDWKSVEPFLRLESLLFEEESRKGKGKASEDEDEEADEAGEEEKDSKEGELKSKRKGLAQLNLKGNGVSLLPSYKDKVTLAYPTLRVLDNQRLSEKLPSRQEARAIIKAARKERRELAKIQRKQEIQDGLNSEERSQSAYDKRKGKKVEKKHRGEVIDQDDQDEEDESGSEVENHERDLKQNGERPKLKHKRAGRRTKKNKKGQVESEGNQPEDEKSRIRARAGPPPGSNGDDEPMLGVESDDEMSAPVQDLDQDDDGGDERGEKKRKRGKRGKKAKSWMTGGDTVVFNDDEDLGNQEEKDLLETKKKRKRSDEDQEGKKKKKKEIKSAWDEGSEAIKPQISVKSLSQPQDQVQEADDKVTEEPKGNSSVAGVVNVKRKSNSKGIKSSNSFIVNNASSELDIGGQDAWGNGSAWD